LPSTLHITNVPPEVVAVLRARAVREGRSLNGEVVQVLADAAARRSLDEVLASIEARASRVGIAGGAPKPETPVRRDRDRRERGAR
jgi:plasmid stability protein